MSRTKWVFAPKTPSHEILTERLPVYGLKPRATVPPFARSNPLSHQLIEETPGHGTPAG